MSPWIEQWTEPLPAPERKRQPRRIVQRTDGRKEAK